MLSAIVMAPITAVGLLPVRELLEGVTAAVHQTVAGVMSQEKPFVVPALNVVARVVYHGTRRVLRTRRVLHRNYLLPGNHREGL